MDVKGFNVWHSLQQPQFLLVKSCHVQFRVDTLVNEIPWLVNESRNSFQFTASTFNLGLPRSDPVSLTAGLRRLKFGSANLVIVEPFKNRNDRKILSDYHDSKPSHASEEWK